MCVAAGVRAVGVVVVQVFVEVASECGELWDERAGEAGSPAFRRSGSRRSWLMLHLRIER